jgi:hypothetical protein
LRCAWLRFQWVDPIEFGEAGEIGVVGVEGCAIF